MGNSSFSFGDSILQTNSLRPKYEKQVSRTRRKELNDEKRQEE